MKNQVRLFIIIVSFLLGSCTNGGFSDILPEADKAPSTGSPDTFTSKSVTTGSYLDLAGYTRPYEMFKVQFGSGDPTFVQWIPNLSASTAGAVLLFMPYGGIIWSDLAIDQKWAGYGNGYHADEDGPNYNASTSSGIDFTIVPPTDAAAEGFPYSFANLHVLIVYGRFHVGGDLQNDIEDVKNGIRFLHSQNLVDKTKIGLNSGSWGGIGILNAVAQMGSPYMPKAIALSYPVSDIKKLNTYISTTIPASTSDGTVRTAYQTFFDPYNRRIDKATEALAGQSNRYDKYSHASLTGITSDIFVAHDDWDTLVPSSQTVDLLSTIASTKKVFYFQRHTAAINFDTFSINHTQSSEGLNNATNYWIYTYLITKLKNAGEAKVSFYDSSDLAAQFTHVMGMKASTNTHFYNDVLQIYCDANLTLVDSDGVASGAGPDIVKLLMDFYSSGWAADGPAVCAKITTDQPF